MIPKASVLSTYRDYSAGSRMPSRTFYIDRARRRIQSYADGLDAMKQAVWKALYTERYEYLIYSWNYGVELSDLLGIEREKIRGDLERRITEALVQDDRITAVTNFMLSFCGESALFSMTVNTVFGNIDMEGRLSDGELSL